MISKYYIEDDWDWVTYFEKEIASFTGSKYAVACDSNSNAIRLLLHYLGIKNKKITIPARTYISVPNQIILSGNIPNFKEIEWDGQYKLGDTPIVDAATAFYKGMFEKNTYTVLSFHFKKILNIGKGGMILTDDEKFNAWARPMIYDGRHKDRLYTQDTFECIGWHMYMTPEEAKRGLEIFYSDRVQPFNKNVGSSLTYSDLREQPIFSKYL